MKIARKQSVAMAVQLNGIVFASDCCALIVQVNVAGVDMTTHKCDTHTHCVVMDEEMMK